MPLSVYTDEHFMKEALKEAMSAYSEGEIPVGAVIISENRVIARGSNQTEKLTDVTAHAEMLAITAASNFLSAKFLENCELFVTLEPCVMCAGAIFWARFRRVVVGAKDPKRGFSLLGGTVLHPKTELKTGVLEKDCGQLLSDFFSKLRN